MKKISFLIATILVVSTVNAQQDGDPGSYNQIDTLDISKPIDWKEIILNDKAITYHITKHTENIENTNYKGINKQGLNLEYPVEIDVSKLVKNEESATVRYIGLGINKQGCSGKLIFVEQYGSKYFFRESIDNRNPSCVNGGYVILEIIREDIVTFHWYYPPTYGINGLTLGASTYLTKVYENYNYAY